MRNNKKSGDVVYAPYLLNYSCKSVGNYAPKLGTKYANKAVTPRYLATIAQKEANRIVAEVQYKIDETEKLLIMSSDFLKEAEEALLKSIKNDESIDWFFRKFGYPSKFDMSEEEFSLLIENLQLVYKYMVENEKWHDTIMNGVYEPSVMILIIVQRLIMDGFYDKITDPETFYNFCVDFTQREYSIPSNRTSGKSDTYAKCCWGAIDKIKDVLKNGA